MVTLDGRVTPFPLNGRLIHNEPGDKRRFAARMEDALKDICPDLATRVRRDLEGRYALHRTLRDASYSDGRAKSNTTFLLSPSNDPEHHEFETLQHAMQREGIQAFVWRGEDGWYIQAHTPYGHGRCCADIGITREQHLEWIAVCDGFVRFDALGSWIRAGKKPSDAEPWRDAHSWNPPRYWAVADHEGLGHQPEVVAEWAAVDRLFADSPANLRCWLSEGLRPEDAREWLAAVGMTEPSVVVPLVRAGMTPGEATCWRSFSGIGKNDYLPDLWRVAEETVREYGSSEEARQSTSFDVPDARWRRWVRPLLAWLRRQVAGPGQESRRTDPLEDDEAESGGTSNDVAS